MTGYDDGVQDGRKEGLAEGIDQQKTETARMMLEDGGPTDKIVRYTGLDKQQAERLRKESQ